MVQLEFLAGEDVCELAAAEDFDEMGSCGGGVFDLGLGFSEAEAVRTSRRAFYRHGRLGTRGPRARARSGFPARSRPRQARAEAVQGRG